MIFNLASATEELLKELGDPVKVTTFEHELLDLYDLILKRGERRNDRTGTGTIGMFGQHLKIDLREGFPVVTTKKLFWKPMAAELLWFIEGSGDERRLAEIQHGTRDPSKKTIWSPNAAGTTGAKFQPAFEGDLGRVYGVQWRQWRSHEVLMNEDSVALDDWSEGGVMMHDVQVRVKLIDQLADVINKLKNNPTDRRIILSAWNPGELDQMALPPCHMFAQFYLNNKRELSCQMYQRSVDSFLGLPFNIASYALLTHLIAHVIGGTVGELTMVLGDTHIYSNHVDQVREQMGREPFPLPTLKFNRQVTSIDDFKLSDFELVGYQSHDSIKAEMSA